MSGKNQTRIREALRANPDGMTVSELRAALGLRGKDGESSVRMAMAAMPDAYIDRWREAAYADWASVWCVVVPPADCPMPGSDE